MKTQMTATYPCGVRVAKLDSSHGMYSACFSDSSRKKKPRKMKMKPCLLTSQMSLEMKTRMRRTLGNRLIRASPSKKFLINRPSSLSLTRRQMRCQDLKKKSRIEI